MLELRWEFVWSYDIMMDRNSDYLGESLVSLANGLIYMLLLSQTHTAYSSNCFIWYESVLML